MKKYIVFQYDNYYPQGGMKDFSESYNDLDEAKNSFCADRGHIVDRDTWKIIYFFK